MRYVLGPSISQLRVRDEASGASSDGRPAGGLAVEFPAQDGEQPVYPSSIWLAYLSQPPEPDLSAETILESGAPVTCASIDGLPPCRLKIDAPSGLAPGAYYGQLILGFDD